MSQSWVGVVSRLHVMRGVAGSFMQLNHGKKAPVSRLKAGDWLAVYSPRTAYPDGELLQAFTALGQVRTGQVYQVEMAPGFQPYRVDVDFLPVHEAPIRPLLSQLSFTRGLANWGAAFRFGQLKMTEEDLALIAQAMGAGHHVMPGVPA